VLGEGLEAFGLIHADLHFDNVLFAAKEARAIDFDDCGYGYWVYDMAAALRPWRTEANWPTFLQAFSQGYAGICALPAGFELLDLFIIARHIAITLWAASRAPYHPTLAHTLHARCKATAEFCEIVRRERAVGPPAVCRAHA